MAIAAEIGERASEEIHQARAKGGQARLPIACAKGCSHCCYLRVEITEAEAEVLAAAITGSGLSRQAEVRKRASAVGSLPLEERLRARTPCALLAADGACSVHARRPLVCRAANSANSDACARLIAAADPGAPLPLDIWSFASLRAAYLGFREGLAAAGRSPQRRELHLVVTEALAHLPGQ